LTKKSLSSKERIKSKKDLKKIFSQGIMLVSGDQKIKAQFIVTQEQENNPGVKITAAVSKKSGKAVWRNRLKRLIRESYRLNKEILINFCVEKNLLLLVVFSTGVLNQKQNRKIKLKEIMDSMIEVMTKIKEGI
jgi:ribonuclease P protein component